jgi:APA family basic amino acid/polyamine antiporter
VAYTLRSDPSNPRQIGLFSAVLIIVASMVGTGVFTTSGFTLADLRTPERVLIAWAVGGLIAALGALSYGALGRRLPESGGEYLFLSRTLHPAAGYIAGWVSFLAGFSAPIAAAALAFGEYSKGWWPTGRPQVAASVMILLAAAVHSTSVRRGLWAHNAAVLSKLAIIGVFLILAGSRLRPGQAQAGPVAAGPFPWADFAVALIWISYSYSGWNAVVYVGGEVRHPGRTLPLALILGTGLVTVLYLVLNAVFVFAAPVSELAGELEVGIIAAEALGGPPWADAVGVLISIVLVAHISGMTLAGPRVYAQMAKDGCLPRWLAPVEGVPRRAILLQAVAALIMLWLAAYDRLLTYIGFTLSVCTAATVVGLFRVRLREGPSMRVPGWPWAPGLFLAMTLWAAFFNVVQRPVESLYGFAVIGLGFAAWWVNRSGRGPRRRPQ